VRAIQAKFRGHCVQCGNGIDPGESCYFDEVDRKVICMSCGTRLGRMPEDSKTAFHGTTNEVIAQLRAQATKLAMELQAASKRAEVIALALKQIEDQRKS
jgi:ribosomal protein S27E